MLLPSDIYRHTDNVKMLGLQKVICFIICKAFCHQSVQEFCFFIVSLYGYQNSAGKVIQRTPYFHSYLYLRTMTKGVRQSSVIRFSVCYLNCCLHIAKLLFTLTVLKYLDNDYLFSSKTSLKYKQYISIIIANQYMVIQSRGVKIH